MHKDSISCGVFRFSIWCVGYAFGLGLGLDLGFGLGVRLGVG